MPPARKTRAAAAATSVTTSTKSSGRQAPAPKTAKATRASRASSAVAETSTPAPKRRLRSTANNNSPLASLPETGRKKATSKTTSKKDKAAVPASPPPESDRSASESIETAEAGQESDGDPGANVFLSEHSSFFEPLLHTPPASPPLPLGSAIFSKPASVVQNITSYVPLPQRYCKPELQHGASETGKSTVDKGDSFSSSSVTVPFSPVDFPVLDAGTLGRMSPDELRVAYSELQSKLSDTLGYLSATRVELTAAKTETNMLKEQLRHRDSKIATIEHEKSQLQEKVNRGSPSKAWLLRKDIEEHAKNVPRGVMLQQEQEHEEDHDTVMESPAEIEVASPTPTSPVQAPSTPEAKSTQAPTTPWSQSIFGWTRNLFGSTSKSTQKPTSPVAPTVPSPLTMTLTQSPTPVGEARSKQNKRKKTKELTRTMDKVVYYTLKSSIAPEDWETARPWVLEASEKIANDKNAGEKRKRLQKGVKVGDLKAIPSTKPWKAQGSFGLDEDIEDLSDSEDAPSWAVANEILAEMDSDMQPTPAKRRKLFTGGDEMVTRTRSSSHVEAPGTSLNVFNTSTSTDIYDLKPRSAVEPSPMFDMAAVHRDGSNVFNELKGQAAGQQSAAEKRAMVQNAVPKEPKSYSQGFSVPDDDSEEEEEESNDWTQAPPPAPVPAHASLPNSFAESQRAQDPAEIQRAKLMKYTPAKPSRLREIHVPSPSLKSDVGASPAPATMIVSDDFDIPDAEPLDLPEDVQAYIDDYINSGKAQAYVEANPWDDPIATFSEDEEMSEE